MKRIDKMKFFVPTVTQVLAHSLFFFFYSVQFNSFKKIGIVKIEFCLI